MRLLPQPAPAGPARVSGASPWHAAFRAQAWFVAGGAAPTAWMVFGSEEFRAVAWPLTPLGVALQATYLLAMTLLFGVLVSTYFLLPALVLGARRAPPGRASCVFAGLAAAIAALAVHASVADLDAVAGTGCATALAASLALTLARPPRARAARAISARESLASRRGSQPFVFGAVAGSITMAADGLRGWLGSGSGGALEGGGSILLLPIAAAALGLLNGVCFALGAGFGAVFRRRAAASTPYGLVAGAVAALVVVSLVEELGAAHGVINLLALALGAAGTLAGPQESRPGVRARSRLRRA